MGNLLHITQNHNGKMEFIQSLSTSCLLNKYCKERMKNNDSVCSKCYARRMMKRYPQLRECLANNHEILTKDVLELDDLPRTNVVFFRFEAFGELENEIQFINYINICKKNKFTNFAIWTKNTWIIDNVFKQGYKKPKNLIIVVSSTELNKQTDIEKYKWADKVFTVYTKEAIKEKDIEINCGGKKCADCLLCYTKNKIKYINEKLK